MYKIANKTLISLSFYLKIFRVATNKDYIFFSKIYINKKITENLWNISLSYRNIFFNLKVRIYLKFLISLSFHGKYFRVATNLVGNNKGNIFRTLMKIIFIFL